MSRMYVGKVTSTILLISVFIASVSINSVFADTRYVSDRLIISVRDGQTPDAAVLGYIETGAPVEVIEETKDFLKIRTVDGIEGWARAQYFVSENPKSLAIDNLNNEINKLNHTIEMLKHKQDSDTSELSKTKQMYQKNMEELKEEVNINQELTAKTKSDFIQLNRKYTNLLNHSKNTKELIRENERLKKSNAQLNAEIKSLRKDRRNPLKSNTIQSFIAGAGVLLFGFIIGGSARKRKKTRFI